MQSKALSTAAKPVLKHIQALHKKVDAAHKKATKAENKAREEHSKLDAPGANVPEEKINASSDLVDAYESHTSALGSACDALALAHSALAQVVVGKVPSLSGDAWSVEDCEDAIGSLSLAEGDIKKATAAFAKVAKKKAAKKG